MTILMEGNIATQDDTIIQGTFSGDGGADTGYTIISDLYIVTTVDFIHQDAAERMRVALTNLNADMCAKNPDYVVRITGSDNYGKKKLDYFIPFHPHIR